MKQRYSTRRKRRTGWTLVEMVCTVTIITMLLGIVSTFLTTVFQFHLRAGEQFADQRSVQRLAMQFRTDVRASSTARLGDEQLVLETLNQQEIRYQIGEDGITRIEGTAEDRTNRDTFWLHRDWQSSWQIEATSAGLTLFKTTTNRPLKSLTISATIGGDADTLLKRISNGPAGEPNPAEPPETQLKNEPQPNPEAAL